MNAPVMVDASEMTDPLEVSAQSPVGPTAVGVVYTGIDSCRRHARCPMYSWQTVSCAAPCGESSSCMLSHVCLENRLCLSSVPFVAQYPDCYERTTREEDPFHDQKISTRWQVCGIYAANNSHNSLAHLLLS